MNPQINSLLESLPRLPFHQRMALPDIPAVYLAISHGSVIYVGSTKTLRLRLWTHHWKDEFEASGAEIAWIQTRNFKEAEARLTEQLRPILNQIYLLTQGMSFEESRAVIQDWLERFRKLKRKQGRPRNTEQS